VRPDREHHGPIAGDSAQAEAIKLVARAHQTVIWDRWRAVLRLRAALRMPGGCGLHPPGVRVSDFA